MPKKNSSRDEITIPVEDIPKHLQERAKEGKTSLKDLTVETLQDGFLIFIQETASGKSTVQYVDLYPVEKKRKDTPTAKLKEYRRLREKFSPVAAGVDYLKDQILGAGIDADIDDLKDETQKDVREWVREFIEYVYQDNITISANEILDLMLDEALTTGASGAEMLYEEDINFMDYVERTEEIKLDGNKKQLMYVVKQPEWKDDENLQGVKRIKIINDAVLRLTAERHPKSQDIIFWALDKHKEKPLVAGGITTNRAHQAIKYHTWEIFWLPINRRNAKELGAGVIAQVYDTAILLEKIEKAIGEGLYRAGNKKYFIVCGTEKRPWGEPHIRNFMKLLKEMASKGWGSIPVPAGFDIKEIGGEVFEGRDIVDHFVGMLAFGMGVPKDAIMMGRGRATETASNVSNVKINRMRNAITRAIRQQLFSRHVWCKYGKEKSKQGGKGTKRVWIPKVRWLKRDFMTTKDRLEAIFKARNVANPVRPEVTLEMDRELAELMGYEVLLPSQEEFQKLLEEMAKEAKEMEEKKLQKEQGKPEPQSLERQEKRQEGMEKKGQKVERGRSKELGGPRTPKEGKQIEETAKTAALKEQLIQKQLEDLREDIKLKKLMQTTERERQKKLKGE